MADKKISELDLALRINNDAVFPMSQDNAGEPTTFKVAIIQLGTEIAEDMTFSNLQTTSKKLVGAINELLSLGNPIIIGTTAPTSSQGADGNIYVQYTEGTGGADDEVDGIFVKIDGAWCEIQTGGGSGTTDYGDLSNKPQVNSVELVGNKSLDDLGIMPASLSKTASGSIAHFTDGGDNIPVKSLVSEIVAVESGNGQPKSPDNPYTISGFSKANIGNISDATNITYFKGVLDGTYNFIDLGSLNWSIDASGRFSAVVSGIKTPTSNGVVANWITMSYSKYTLTDSNSVASNNNTYGLTTGANLKVKDSDYSDSNTFKNAMNGVYLIYELATPTTPTITPEQFSSLCNAFGIIGNLYTFAFGQTVYGGYFDNKGNFVISHGMVDLGTLNWSDIDGSGLHNSSNISDILEGGYAQNLSDYLCEIFRPKSQYVDWASLVNGEYGTNNKYIRVKWTDISSGADFKTFVTGKKLIYPLANPITLSITSQDIPTLLGENNIFSNCGDVEVNYYTDKADEIVKVSKATASTPLHNYSTDEQIIGTWIDGSTIYEKTISFTTPNDSNYTQQSVGLLTAEIDKVWVVDGFTYKGGTYVSVMPYAYTTTVANEQFEGFIYKGSTNITFDYKVGNQLYEAPAYVTIRYTKSST